MKRIEYRPLYTKAKRKKSIYDFIYSLINNSYLYTNGMFLSTYYEASLDNMECYSARRSFNDIYCIVKTQYLSLTVLLLHKILKQLHKDNKIGTFYCDDINKIVFRNYVSSNYSYHNLEKLGIRTSTRGLYTPCELRKIWNKI